MKKVSIILLTATMLLTAGVTASPTAKAPKEQVSKIDNAIVIVWSEELPGYSERFALLPVCLEQPPVLITDEVSYWDVVQESLDEPYIEGESPVPIRWLVKRF